LAARSHKLQKKKVGKTTVGKLVMKVTCDQSVDVTLSGKLTSVQKVPGSRRTKTTRVRLQAVHGKATAGTPLTLTVTIPATAVSALKKGAKESAAVALSATNVNGIVHATTTVTALRI
jgi:hypothetical protein